MKSHHAMVSKIRCLPACRPAGKDERLAMAGRLLVPSTMSWAEEWHKAGGLEKCPMVCAGAARIAADIILRLKEKSNYKSCY
ncbi:MAG: hypothetical protein JRJ45_04720 [Deltaproteobacteria bacterium]|nr:hypothetical protein [Deltaproteobacteria bacterium]